MSLKVIVNGQPRVFEQLLPGSNVAELVAALGIQSDRVAIELNGTIASRAGWVHAALADGDRIEMVHFVGGGCGTESIRSSS